MMVLLILTACGSDSASSTGVPSGQDSASSTGVPSGQDSASSTGDPSGQDSASSTGDPDDVTTDNVPDPTKELLGKLGNFNSALEYNGNLRNRHSRNPVDIDEVKFSLTTNGIFSLQHFIPANPNTSEGEKKSPLFKWDIKAEESLTSGVYPITLEPKSTDVNHAFGLVLAKGDSVNLMIFRPKPQESEQQQKIEMGPYLFSGSSFDPSWLASGTAYFSTKMSLLKFDSFAKILQQGEITFGSKEANSEKVVSHGVTRIEVDRKEGTRFEITLKNDKGDNDRDIIIAELNSWFITDKFNSSGSNHQGLFQDDISRVWDIYRDIPIRFRDGGGVIRKSTITINAGVFKSGGKDNELYLAGDYDGYLDRDNMQYWGVFILFRQ